MAEDKEDAPLVPDSVGDEDTKILNLNIKTTKKKEPVQVAADCTIKKVSGIKLNIRQFVEYFII